MTVADLSPGAIVDNRYKVSSRLGAGGMADVFLAEDQQLGRKVALKLLHRRFAADPDFVERFRREAQAAAGLQHPHVVSVYDRGSFEDTYYIAMEYLPGRSLKQLIRQEAPLDPIRAIDITVQILKAARFAHRRGVIHRDLKPHNVIIDDADQAKVTDFGIARAGASDMTETGSIMGTAQYLSPEQAQGHAVSAGSDLYSIAVVLYEMLTGRVPFDGESAVTIALKHVSEAPVPPRRLNPAVPNELEQVVLWALNKNPADRPLDADQFITALEAAKAAILGQPGQRTASMATLAAVGGAAGGYAAAAAGATPQDAAAAYRRPSYEDTGSYDTEPPREPPSREATLWPWITLLIVLLIAGGAVAAYLLTRPQKRIVPTVTNQTLNTARTVLQNEGFSVSVLSVTNDKPAGTVIGQDPQGNSQGRRRLDRDADRVDRSREHDRAVGRRAQREGGETRADQGATEIPRPTRDVDDDPQGQRHAHRAGRRGVGRRRLDGDAVHLVGQADGQRAQRRRRVAVGRQRAADQRRLPRSDEHADVDRSARRQRALAESRGQHERGAGLDRQPRDRPGADDRPGPRCPRRHGPGAQPTRSRPPASR